jgi:hypothetical protein
MFAILQPDGKKKSSGMYTWSYAYDTKPFYS